MLESTLLVDIGQLGDIFAPFMDFKILMVVFNFLKAPLKTLDLSTTFSFSGLS